MLKFNMICHLVFVTTLLNWVVVSLGGYGDPTINTWTTLILFIVSVICFLLTFMGPKK